MRTLNPHDFRDELDGFSVGFLCTHIPDAGLTARPMRLLGKLEGDDRLWFATSLKSPKIADLSADPEVCVTFQDGARYATISGEAEIVISPDKAIELWSESLRIWFPDGARSEDLALVAVSPWSGELWDMSGVVRKLRFALAASRAYFTGEAVSDDALDHARMQLVE
ncbi:MAG: pyridoxamine 5'-phosphate oxidase family protein [Planctomycetota bacterium]